MSQNALKRPTMRDVASLAGVGIATVSRVVNNKGRVSPSTEQRIRQAISALGFEPNEIARSLRPGQVSRTIGVKVGDLTNPFWSHVCKGAIAAARQEGYAVILGSSDENYLEEQRTLADLLSRRVAGLIIAPDRKSNPLLRDESGEPQLPIVFVDRPSKDLSTDTVVLDNFNGGYLASKELVAAGHTRIATIVAPSYYTTGLRLRGFRKALAEAEIEIPEEYVAKLEHGSPEEAASAVRRLVELPSPPTAIFSTTNFLTQGIVKEMGGELGGLALVGFDDFDLAGILPTPISVVASDAEQLGRTAVTLLIERIEGFDSPPRREMLPVHLIARESSRKPPQNRI